MKKILSALMLTAMATHSVEIACTSLKRQSTITVHSLQELDTAIKASNTPIILSIYAQDCPPCTEMRPIFKKLAEEMSTKMTFIEFGIKTAMHNKILEVNSLPTFIVYKNGLEVARITGIQSPEEFREKISKLMQQ